MKFIKDPAVDQLAFDERIRWARETLDYLDRLFGLKPGDFAVDEVQIKPSDQIGSIGDYYPDERVIELPDSLLPHVGGIHPGMYKAANGRWKNVFRHELGHAFEDAFEQRARRIDSKFSLDSIFESARPTTQRDLSWYSGKNRHEWFADTFSSYTHPRFERSGVRLHDELKALLDHVIPRCHCEGECDCRGQSRTGDTFPDGFHLHLHREDAGSSEGARKGWLKRQRGLGEVEEEPKPDPRQIQAELLEQVKHRTKPAGEAMSQARQAYHHLMAGHHEQAFRKLPAGTRSRSLHIQARNAHQVALRAQSGSTTMGVAETTSNEATRLSGKAHETEKFTNLLRDSSPALRIGDHVLHLPDGYDAFVEAEHPRGSRGTSIGGQFIARGAGAGRAVAQRGAELARRAGGAARHGVGEFTRFDQQIIQEKLKPGSTPRKHLAAKVSAIARSLPAMLKGHLAEEKEHAIHAAGALKALASGKRPTHHQLVGLRNFGVRVLMSAGSMALFGEPTGAVAHIAGEFAQEIVQHVVLEHTAKAVAGLGRFAIGRDDAGQGDLSPEDYKLLQAFVERLAKAAQEFELPDDRAREILGVPADPKQPGHDRHFVVGDRRPIHIHLEEDFKEAEHPRAHAGTETGGQFVKKGEEGTPSTPSEQERTPERIERTEPAREEPEAKPKPAPKRAAKTRAGPSETFISPNTGNLNFAGAEHETHGKRQTVFAEVSAAIDRRLGIRQVHSANVIGAWSDGAENSLMVTVAGDPQLVRAAAAMKGWIAEQKAVLVFNPDLAGDEHMANFELRGNLDEIHDQLLKEGLQFHTLEPTETGAIVHIYASDQDTVDTAGRVAKTAGSEVRFVSGKGEFIGTSLETGTDEEQRADARAVYERVFEEASHTGRLDRRDLEEVRRDADNHWRAATGAAEGVGLVGSHGHPALISTRRPTAAGALESDRYRRADLASLRQDSAGFEHNMGLLRSAVAYPNFRPEDVAGSPDEIARAAIDHAKANLRFLYENAPDDLREQAHLWYEGANRLAAEQADKYRLPLQSTVGVYAALSPQKLWDINVSLAERTIDIHQTKQNHRWDAGMDETAARIWKPKDKAVVDLIRGKRLGELAEPAEKAMWIRTYDQTHNDPGFDRLSPDGRRLGPYLTAAGKPASATWQSTQAIASAIRALESNGDRGAISATMGNNHKVRSFYNNILDPHSANDDVTIDTHAVGAALLRPLSSATTPVMQSFGLSPLRDQTPPGWQGTSSSSTSGSQGLYGLWAEAYRETAKEFGIEPRVLQSATWEAKRRLFDEHLTHAARRAVEQAWVDYHDGKVDLPSTQQAILKLAGGMDKPGDDDDTGRRPADSAHAQDANRYHAAKLHRSGVGIEPAGPVDTGARGGIAGRVARFTLGKATPRRWLIHWH